MVTFRTTPSGGRHALTSACWLSGTLAIFAAAPSGAATVTITSTPANGTHYVLGEAITTRIANLSPGISGVGGAPFTTSTMSINIGGTTRNASVTSGCCGGITTADFSYTVTRDDIDTDGISIPANSIGGPIWRTMLLGTVDRSHTALTNQAGHAVIGSTAAVSSIPAGLNSGNLNGATIEVSLTGSTFVAGVAAANFSITATGITGMGVANASRRSGTTAALTLSYSGGALPAARTFFVTVAPAAHAGTISLRTGNVTVEPHTPANQPPRVVGTVDDLDLALGESSRVQLFGLFADEHPHGLAYAVSSSSPAVAARLAGTAVALAGSGHGAATITVTATDAEGLSAELSFVVRSGTTIGFVADASAPEGGTIRLRLAVSHPAPRALSVPYVLAAASESATSTAFIVRRNAAPPAGDDVADESDHAGGAGGTVMFAAGATSAEIAVPIVDDDRVEPVREHFFAMLAEPADDAGYGLGVKTQAVATIDEGVCDRAPAVRDALRRSRACAAVADLSRHTALRLPRAGITQLRAEDLLELDQLRLLDLSGNQLSAWPAEVFGTLPLLTSLRLDGNHIATLPRMLGAHGQLTELNLSGNRLSMLPAGALRGLASLERLHLSNNALATLPKDAFKGLARLNALSLDGNALRALPAGLFLGLGRLQSLQLQGNPGAPFPLTVELTRTDADPWAPGPASVAARVSSGAPFTLRGVLSVSGGSLPDGDALSVPAGQALGTPVTVAADAPVTARLSWPEVPRLECEFAEGRFRPCFQGVITVLGAPLVLFKQPPTAVTGALPPQQTLDAEDTLRLDLAAAFKAADAEPLTLTAVSSDPTVAQARVIDGTLVVEALAEGVATVTVTATDAYGQTATLRFELQANALPVSFWRGWRSTLLDAPDQAR